MLLIVAAIALSTAAGVAAERRWPDRAGPRTRDSLLLVLYVILPPTTFFNLAAIDFDANLGGGIAIGWVAIALAALAAWFLIGDGCSTCPGPQVGAMMACTLVGEHRLPRLPAHRGAARRSTSSARPSPTTSASGAGAADRRLRGGRRVRHPGRNRRARADRLLLRPQPAPLRRHRGAVRPRRARPRDRSSTSRGSSSSRSSPSASSRSARRSPRRPTPATLPHPAAAHAADRGDRRREARAPAGAPLRCSRSR